jgi:hypothetical protein
MKKIYFLLFLVFIFQGCKNDYDQGVQNLNEKKFDKALVEFEKVPSGNDNYRKAQSKINYINGLNAFNKSKFDEAKTYFDKVDSFDEIYPDVKVMLDKIALEEKSKKLDEELTEMDSKLKQMEIKMLNDEEKKKYNTNIRQSDFSGLCGSYPEASYRYLYYDDIAGKTKRQLKVMRNEIFMRHGYIFKTDDMRNHFSSYPCYSPRYNDVTSLLSDVEKQNVEFIKQWE